MKPGEQDGGPDRGGGLLRELERLGLAPMVEAEPAPWGGKNTTRLLRLADGTSLIEQRYRSAETARVRLRAHEVLAPLLRERGVPVSRVVASDPAGRWGLLEALPGEVGYVVADHDLSGAEFPAMARAMGEVLRRMREVPVAGLGLPSTWAVPADLAASAGACLDRLRPHTDPGTVSHAEEVLQRLPELLTGRPVVLGHGDYGPQNVLFEGTRVTGLLDLEDARICDPLADVAWWAWFVRAHTPDAFDRSWRAFLDGAEIDLGAGETEELLFALLIARLLETAEHFRLTRPEKHPSWGRRLRETLAWDGVVSTVGSGMAGGGMLGGGAG